MTARQSSVETVAANVDALDAVGDARLRCALPLIRFQAETVRRFLMTSANYLLLPLTAGEPLVGRAESCEANSDIVERKRVSVGLQRTSR